MERDRLQHLVGGELVASLRWGPRNAAMAVDEVVPGKTRGVAAAKDAPSKLASLPRTRSLILAGTAARCL